MKTKPITCKNKKTKRRVRKQQFMFSLYTTYYNINWIGMYVGSCTDIALLYCTEGSNFTFPIFYFPFLLLFCFLLIRFLMSLLLLVTLLSLWSLSLSLLLLWIVCAHVFLSSCFYMLWVWFSSAIPSDLSRTHIKISSTHVAILFSDLSFSSFLISFSFLLWLISCTIPMK